jgi:uncharacterized membrane protein YkoI
MFQRLLRGLTLGLGLLLAVSVTGGTASSADRCLPPSQAPRGLGEFIGAIQALTGGQLVHACLLNDGGRYIYKVQIQVGGRVITRIIDLSTGKIQ